MAPKTTKTETETVTEQGYQGERPQNQPGYEDAGQVQVRRERELREEDEADRNED